MKCSLYTSDAMKGSLRLLVAGLLAYVVLTHLFVPLASASAYNGRPKLIVIVVIDQFRGDYLERYRDQFGEGGFRLFLDRGAYFTDCYYDYANTRTAPGHATFITGAYSSGHGIMANEWWDPQKKRTVTSVKGRRHSAGRHSGRTEGRISPQFAQPTHWATN